MRTRLIAALIAWLGFAANAHATERVQTSLTATLDYSTLPAAEPHRAFLKVGLLPGEIASDCERPPIQIAIVLDRSGSMSGQKLEVAKRAALEAIRLLQPEDRVSLIVYDENVDTLISLCRKGSIRNLEGIIGNVRAGGSTAIYAAVNQAAAEIRKWEESNAFNRILLLSDGLANVGPDSPADFSRLSRALARERISVSTIGLGSGYNEDLMTQLSAAGEGNAYFAESAYDLPRIFEAELGDATTVVVQDARIEIELGDSFRPLRFVGRDGKIEGQRAVFELSQLYGGQEKFALLEIESKGGPAESRATVANVTATFYDRLKDRRQTLTDRSLATYSNRIKEVSESVNVPVQRAVVDNRIAEAQTKAVSLADAGDDQAASAELKKLNAWIQESNADWRDEEIEERSRLLETQASELENAGMSADRRKEMRSEAYQSSRQQKAYK